MFLGFGTSCWEFYFRLLGVEVELARELEIEVTGGVCIEFIKFVGVLTGLRE